LIIKILNDCRISILATCPAHRVADTSAHGQFNPMYLKRMIARCDHHIPCACQGFRRGLGARPVRAGCCSSHTIVRTVACIQEQRRPDGNPPHQRFLCLFYLNLGLGLSLPKGYEEQSAAMLPSNGTRCKHKTAYRHSSQ
jgi:hypothetical protein